jgi:hypothetical protein
MEVDGEDARHIHVTLSLRAIIILGGAVLLAAVVLTVALVYSGQKSNLTSTQILLNALNRNLDPERAKHLENISTTNLPAWGELVVHNIEVERPEEYINLGLATNQYAEWFFEGLNTQNLNSFLLSSGLAAEQVARLLDTNRCHVKPDGVVLHPDDQLIMAMKPASRRKVYNVLASSSANHFQYFPFCFRGNTFSNWFELSGLKKSTMDTVESMLYQRGNAVCFSDVEAVLRALASDDERTQLIKTLSRQNAVLLELHITPNTDVDRLLGYWGKGIRLKDIRPLLESLKRLPEGTTLDIVHVMPAFARRRLYTYPVPPTSPNEPQIDCHWTTMNFFSENPDDRFTDSNFLLNHLKTEFYQISKASSYGDVVFLINQKGTAIHSAIFLADDIVFTKNGNTHMQPWTLMRLDDLLATYPSDVPLQLVVYRNRKW